MTAIQVRNYLKPSRVRDEIGVLEEEVENDMERHGTFYIKSVDFLIENDGFMLRKC